MRKDGWGKSLLLAGLALAGLSACADGAAETQGGVEADPDVYGTDGYETVNGIAFVPAQEVYDRYARGEVGCYRFDFDSNSCTSIEYARLVQPGMLEVDGYLIESSYAVKQVLPFRYDVKGKYICYTNTLESINNWTVYSTQDDLARVSMNDTIINNEAIEQWRDSNRRRLAATLDVEQCMRFSPVIENGQAVPGAYYQYNFIGGIMQPQREMVELSLFKGEDLERLHLRPAVE